MLEDLWARAKGPVGAGLLVMLLLPGGRKAARGALKALTRAGLQVCDYVQEIRDEIQQERDFYAGVTTDRSKAS